MNDFFIHLKYKWITNDIQMYNQKSFIYKGLRVVFKFKLQIGYDLLILTEKWPKYVWLFRICNLKINTHF